MIAASPGRARRAEAMDQEQHQCPGSPPPQSLATDGLHDDFAVGRNLRRHARGSQLRCLRDADSGRAKESPTIAGIRILRRRAGLQEGRRKRGRPHDWVNGWHAVRGPSIHRRPSPHGEGVVFDLRMRFFSVPGAVDGRASRSRRVGGESRCSISQARIRAAMNSAKNCFEKFCDWLMRSRSLLRRAGLSLTFRILSGSSLTYLNRYMRPAIPGTGQETRATVQGSTSPSDCDGRIRRGPLRSAGGVRGERSCGAAEPRGGWPLYRKAPGCCPSTARQPCNTRARSCPWTPPTVPAAGAGRAPANTTDRSRADRNRHFQISARPAP